MSDLVLHPSVEEFDRLLESKPLLVGGFLGHLVHSLQNDRAGHGAAGRAVCRKGSGGEGGH